MSELNKALEENIQDFKTSPKEFRARDKTKKYMQYFDSLHQFCSKYYAYEHVYIPLQRTGLYDKNGSKIREGDIVKFSPYSMDIIATVEVVRDSIHGCRGYTTQGANVISPHEPKLFDVEIVGNIFENSSLLTTPPNGKA